MGQHKSGEIKGFTSKYHVHLLVYYESTMDVLAAIGREKQIKGWTRAKKVALIESVNPHWDDLGEAWCGGDPSRTQTLPPPPDSFAETHLASGERGRRSE